jgi:hypothetical protein
MVSGALGPDHPQPPPALMAACIVLFTIGLTLMLVVVGCITTFSTWLLMRYERGRVYRARSVDQAQAADPRRPSR